MTLKVEITNTQTQVMSGTAKRSGKPYEMHLQTAYLHNGGAYPEKFEIILPKPEREGDAPKPYPVGNYAINLAESVKVFGGRINFSPVLVPVAGAGK